MKNVKVATIGTVTSIISLVMVGVWLLVTLFVGKEHNLLGLAWASVTQLNIPVLGTLPVLPLETLYLMALVDISTTSNLFIIFGLTVATFLVFAAGGVMLGYGFYRIYRQEQSTMSLIASLFLIFGFGLLAVIMPLGAFPQTIISPWTFLFYYHFSILIPLTQFTLGSGLGISLAAFALIALVVYVILGTTMIVIRDRTPKPDLMLAAGILTIIGGILLLGIVGIILLFVAYILLALVFNELEK